MQLHVQPAVGESLLTPQKRFHLVRSCLLALDQSFMVRGWKFSTIPPDRSKIMPLGGHPILVSHCGVLIAAEEGANPDEVLLTDFLGKHHDNEEAITNDRDWSQQRFVTRKKVEARHYLFEGLAAAPMMLELLDRLESAERPKSIYLWHNDAHQVASLLELKAYIDTGLIRAPDYRHSIGKLQSKLMSDTGHRLFEDINRLPHLPSRSALGWEDDLWHNLGLPGSRPAD